MIIDVHAHIGSSEKFDRFFKFNEYLKLMKENNINYSIVMPNVSSIKKSSELNAEFFYDLVNLKNNYKKKLIPLMLIDPRDDETYQQLLHCKNAIKGVKFHPSIFETKFNDNSLVKFLNLISNYKIPIIVHCGRNKISHISYIVEVAKIFKNVDFIAAHMGGNASDLIEESINILKKEKLNNLYLDTSANKLPFLIEKAVKTIGSRYLLFGSDEPYADVRISKYCIEISDISIQEKKDIFYENSKRVFNINL